MSYTLFTFNRFYVNIGPSGFEQNGKIKMKGTQCILGYAVTQG